MIKSDSLKQQVQDLPDKPGVYRFFDITDTLLYVGKAKSLKKRVLSYFSKFDALNRKTQRLVTQIEKIEFTIVNTEFDALLLENNLIKNYQPKYNVLLKDDKTFPFLYISHERFPRLITTRQLDKSLGEFYGPFTNVKAMNTLFDLIRKLFYLRTCNYNLSEENIQEKKFKVCLEYHIGNCKGPCENLVSEEVYNKNIAQIRNILKGKIGVVKDYFKEEMVAASSGMEFEKAQQFKDKLELLERFQSSSLVVNPDISDLEVFTIVSDEKIAIINYFSIENGTIIHTNTELIKKKLEESDEEILLLSIVNTRELFHSSYTDIITNIPIETDLDKINISVPKIGDKKKLIELSMKNCLYKMHKYKLLQEQNAESRVVSTLQKDLQLKEPPDHIECFDNSNIQGTHPVSAMVCFKNGKPSKKDYRHFNIKTVEGPNDFASMKEVIYRRYKRCLEEHLPLPKLIIVDGGKGQLSSACESLRELDLYGKIPIIGIAKNLEEIFFPNDSYPLYIDKRSESLRLIQYMRDEAHRFGINFHRDKRSKGSLNSALTDIKGIGENTYNELIKKFKSLSRIKEASIEEIEEVVGKKKATLIKNYFEEQKE